MPLLPALTNLQATAVVLGASVLCAVYVWLVVAPLHRPATRKATAVIAAGEKSASDDDSGAARAAPRPASALHTALLCAPVWVVFCALPFVFDGQRTQAIGALFTAAIVSWWASFKLLALAWRRGALYDLIQHAHANEQAHGAAAAGSGAVPFVVTLLLPVVIQLQPPTPTPASASIGAGKSNGSNGVSADHSNGNGNSDGNGRGAKASASAGDESLAVQLARAGVKLLALLALVVVIDRTPGEPYASTLHHVCCYGCMYLGASLMMDSCALLARPLFGVRLSAHFNEPYLSASVTQFWSERWNITASRVLRDSVYDPVLYGVGTHATGRRQRQRPSRVRRAVAVMAAFVASGVAHELLLRTVLPVMTFEWTLFFVLNGLLCLAESYARRAGVWWPAATPLWVQRVATIGVLLGLAELCFLPPVTQTGLADRLVSEILIA